MSKEIDFSKAPEGATHYAVNRDREIIWYRSICLEGYEFYCEYDIGSGGYFDGWLKNKDNTEYHAIPIHEQWSIYTNDKPLSELSDEQKAALFNSWVKGEVRQRFKSGKFIDMAIDECNWHTGVVYRIKQKSGRELFIEAAMDLMTSETERTLEQMFGALFDSGKFKLVEQSK